MEQLWNPGNWANPEGYWLLWLAIIVTLVGILAKLAGLQWDDWLDERVGRGSVEDDWPFDRLDRRNRAPNRG
ncbi:MAG: hypothetical protein ACRD0G_05275 [Acidimicrobiales bacterium]